MECMHNITLNMVSFDHLKNCLATKVAMREVDFVLAIEFLASKMLQYHKKIKTSPSFDCVCFSSNSVSLHAF